MNTFLHDEVWIHGATIYGIATQPETQRVKQQTDDLLALATNRIVCGMTGCRFICGDFNQESDLPQVELWKRMGWKEAQSMQTEHTGQPIQATCKHKTRKDYIWVSPEMQPFFDAAEVIPHVFPDHSALIIHFHPLGLSSKIYHWHKPQPLPWSEICHKLSDAVFPLDRSQSAEAQCSAIAQELENRVDQQYQAECQRSLHPCQKGRCTVTNTTTLKPHSRPIKPSRPGEAQPEYQGMSPQHQRWFTQLRRVQSLNRLMTKPLWSLAQEIHAHREWRAILQAPGFLPNFKTWWQQLSSRTETAPLTLTDSLPTTTQMQGLLATLDGEIRAFERILQRTFVQRAKHNRAANPNRIFRDFKKPFANPVQLLDHSKVATVVEVNHEDHALVLDKSPDFSPGPISGPKGLFTPYITSDEIVWVDPQDLVEPGSILRQENLIGHLDQLFEQFAGEWSQRWDRHKDLPEDHWDAVLDFFRQAFPKQENFDLPPMTYEIWMQAVKKKKTRAATGPDGLSKEDLLRMPKPLTMAMLSLFEQIETSDCPWPSQWMHGYVHLLKKAVDAAHVSQFRPITLFALPYRVWSSIRTAQILHKLMDLIPSQCYGSIPGRSASHMWMELQQLIETAHDCHEPLAGGVADIQKCFNHIPRYPILGVLLYLGLPHTVVRAWAKGLHQMTRHFRIRQSTGPGLTSCTGFAEGCPLSIIAMIGVNVVVDFWVKLRKPSCQFWSYIDNHEVTARSAAAAERAFQALGTILSILDLPIDHTKSYVWATTTQARKQLAQSKTQLVRSCRDLGGQMQYTRVCNNYVITKRIEAFKPRWKDLAISPAPYSQKLRALRTVAWTTVLHGIPSAHQGPQHYDGLRTQALRALNEHGAGVSPLVHLSLVELPEYDPEFFALVTTTLHCRQILTRDQVEPMVSSLCDQPPRHRPKPGPVSVMKERMKKIHWEWTNEGQLMDHEGLLIDLWLCPIQLLRRRLQDAWQQHVCQITSTRKTFAGMEHIHARFSTENFPAQPRDAALLRTAMNGAFFTGEHLKQRDPDATGNCQLCWEFEDVFHRQWTCPALASARQLSQAQTDKIQQMQPATYNHGWFPLPASVHKFHNALTRVDPFPPTEIIHRNPETCHLHFFTNGACRFPEDPYLRLCSWGVVVVDSHTPGATLPIANGILHGLCQTIARAELKAVLEALNAAWRHQCPFSIWCDSQIVVDKLRYIHQNLHHIWPGKIKNHDLLNSIASMLRQVSPHLKYINKVSSHQDLRQADDDIDDWCFRCNYQADSLAEQAFTADPELQALHAQAAADIAHARTLRDAFHKQLVAVGLLSVTKIQKLSSAPTNRAPGPTPPPIQMQPWILDNGTPCPNTFEISTYAALLTWNRTSHNPDGVVQAWSWWELYIDVCVYIPAFAPAYNYKSLRWYNDNMPTAPFLKRTKSFARYVSKFSHHLGIELPSRIANPQSSHIAFWTKCLPVQVDANRHAGVDKWLGQHITGASKTSDLSVVPWSLDVFRAPAVILTFYLTMRHV